MFQSFLNSGDNFAGKTAWVYGWGQASFTSNQAQVKLQKLQLKVSSNKECSAWSTKNNMNWDLGPGQVCAGAGAGKDACKVNCFYNESFLNQLWRIERFINLTRYKNIQKFSCDKRYFCSKIRNLMIHSVKITTVHNFENNSNSSI